VVVVKGDPKADEEFYMYAADAAEKLSIYGPMLRNAVGESSRSREDQERAKGSL
jgi:hypothetical protein